MRLINRRSAAISLLLVAVAATLTLLAMRGAAHASSTPTPVTQPAGYSKPTGPELSPVAAAEAAVAAAREGVTVAGTIDIRMAHGTYAQAAAVLNEGESVNGPSTSGPASCFPGMACNSAEIEEHERIEREIDESSAYIVEMSGKGFSPPVSRLKKGESASSVVGEIETVIVDAHTGAAEARTIGGQSRNLTALGAVTELTATIPSQATAAAVVRARQASYGGTILGRVVGLSEHHVLVVVSEGDMKISPRDEHVVKRATTSAKNTFEMKEVVQGRYSIGVQRSNCVAQKITVRDGKTTKVTLKCHS